MGAFSDAPVVLVLMDDDEFGKALKWFFSRPLASLVEFKHLIIIIEAYMDVMVYAGQYHGELNPSPPSNPEKPFQYDLPPDILVKSRLFCFTFPSTALLSGSFVNLDTRDDVLSLLHGCRVSSLVPGQGTRKAISWELLSGIRVRIGDALPASKYPNEIFITSPIVLDKGSRDALFILAWLQFNIATRSPTGSSS
nr:hypothetical protein [Candidatus Sigynarchaeota archaeon]